MKCEAVKRLLEVDVDGELDLMHHVEVDAHVGSCPECARFHAGLRARRAVLQERLVRHRAPMQLVERVATSLGIASRSVPNSPGRRSPARLVAQVIVLAASIVVAISVGFRWGAVHSRSAALVAQAVEQHVRSLQAEHLTDVTSTDEHTVKPWFSGKLDFSPPVVDLAGNGFPLIGGRLDRLDGHTAAALVFRRRQHAINLFVWVQTDETPPLSLEPHDGFSVVSWSARGMSFLAVSEVNAVDLGLFAETFRARVR